MLELCLEIIRGKHFKAGLQVARSYRACVICNELRRSMQPPWRCPMRPGLPAWRIPKFKKSWRLPRKRRTPAQEAQGDLKGYSERLARCRRALPPAVEAAAVEPAAKVDDVASEGQQPRRGENAKPDAQSKRAARIAGHAEAELSNYVKFLTVDKENMKEIVESVERLTWLHMDVWQACDAFYDC